MPWIKITPVSYLILFIVNRFDSITKSEILIVIDKFAHRDTAANTPANIQAKFETINANYMQEIRFSFKRIEKCTNGPDTLAPIEIFW